MSQDQRYYFVIPRVDHPVGGVNVLFEMIEILRASGRQAFPLYSYGQEAYAFADYDGPAFYDGSLPKLFSKTFPVRRLNPIPYIKSWSAQKPKTAAAPNATYEPQAGDTIVVPDFWYPELSMQFTDQKKILVSQDVFGFLRPNIRDRATGTNELGKFQRILTTSDVAADIIYQTTGLRTDRVTLNVGDNLSFQKEKKLQIAYIPRKRREEAEIVIKVLRDLPEFSDVSFVAIGGGMSNDAVAQTLHDSLIFLSFCWREGFGLPPAEAMKAGCITIGYTGVGGNEYFTPETGFPILDNDVADFIATARRVVTEYRNDPTALDKHRKAGSDIIGKRYNAEAMQSTVLAAWDKIELLDN